MLILNRYKSETIRIGEDVSVVVNEIVPEEQRCDLTIHATGYTIRSVLEDGLTRTKDRQTVYLPVKREDTQNPNDPINTVKISDGTTMLLVGVELENFRSLYKSRIGFKSHRDVHRSEIFYTHHFSPTKLIERIIETTGKRELIEGFISGGIDTGEIWDAWMRGDLSGDQRAVLTYIKYNRERLEREAAERESYVICGVNTLKEPKGIKLAQWEGIVVFLLGKNTGERKYLDRVRADITQGGSIELRDQWRLIQLCREVIRMEIANS